MDSSEPYSLSDSNFSIGSPAILDTPPRRSARKGDIVFLSAHCELVGVRGFYVIDESAEGLLVTPVVDRELATETCLCLHGSPLAIAFDEYVMIDGEQVHLIESVFGPSDVGLLDLAFDCCRRQDPMSMFDCGREVSGKDDPLYEFNDNLLKLLEDVQIHRKLLIDSREFLSEVCKEIYIGNVDAASFMVCDKALNGPNFFTPFVSRGLVERFPSIASDDSAENDLILARIMDSGIDIAKENVSCFGNLLNCIGRFEIPVGSRTLVRLVEEFKVCPIGQNLLGEYNFAKLCSTDEQFDAAVANRCRELVQDPDFTFTRGFIDELKTQSWGIALVWDFLDKAKEVLEVESESQEVDRFLGPL